MQIINVMGASIDGRIASHPNESDEERKRYGFTNEADHAHLRRLLTTCDAVIVGGHSVNVSGGVMEVQREDGVYPTWVLCSNSGFLSDQPIWSQPNTPKWLVSREALEEEPRCMSSRCCFAREIQPCLGLMLLPAQVAVGGCPGVSAVPVVDAVPVAMLVVCGVEVEVEIIAVVRPSVCSSCIALSSMA